MSSLVSKSQQPPLDKETACLFLKLGIFSRNNPLFSGFFQQLKFLKITSDVILFISQLINSMREKIRELFSQIEIQISEEQLRLLMESPTDTFNSFMSWRDYFINIMNEKQRKKYRENYRDQFIPFEELISFSKSFYSNNSFIVYIKSLTGRSIDIQITHQMSIEEMKMIVQEKEGIPIDQQRFIFAGRQLDDSMLVGMYNITKEANINLVLRLRGGMYHKSSNGRLMDEYEIIYTQMMKENLNFELHEILGKYFESM
jgi:hypothetical protein